MTLLQAIERDAARCYALLLQTRFCLDLPVRDEGEHRRGREDGPALVGEVEGAAVAFVLAVPKDGRVHLLEIAVAEAHQGRGYGRLLFAAIEPRGARIWL